ncbi:MAG: N-acetyltransferase [Sphingobacteriales bacterium]|nr:MAG: N-acetyltransferase [Sphingobacteriales bacterium]
MFVKTDRTTIRPFVHEDLDELSSLCALTETMAFIPPYFGPETREQAAARLDKYIKHYEEHGVSFGHVANDEGKFIGRAGLYFVPEVSRFEIGYSLLPQYWGQGLATEIAQGLLDYAFDTLNMDSVCARTIMGNQASEAVLHKTGFSFLGERAFRLDDRIFFWNYFERDNDDLPTYREQSAGQFQMEEWDYV